MVNRRKFSAEFRAEAVELVVSSGRPITLTPPIQHFFDGNCTFRKKTPPRRARQDSRRVLRVGVSSPVWLMMTRRV